MYELDTNLVEELFGCTHKRGITETQASFGLDGSLLYFVTNCLFVSNSLAILINRMMSTEIEMCYPCFLETTLRLLYVFIIGVKCCVSS
jgi:hypothetical protein